MKAKKAKTTTKAKSSDPLAKVPADVLEVAVWMFEQVVKRGEVYQDEVVCEIKEQFGDKYVYTNDRGNFAIEKRVLKAFRDMSEDTVVWERGSRLWRRRMSHDEPGRRQY